jgi:hypothetical protein
LPEGYDVTQKLFRLLIREGVLLINSLNSLNIRQVREMCLEKILWLERVQKSYFAFITNKVMLKDVKGGVFVVKALSV